MNHTGSFGAMELTGALDVFHCSMSQYNLRYTKYRGDRDSKPYKDIVDADPYPKYKIEKSKCIGRACAEICKYFSCSS